MKKLFLVIFSIFCMAMGGGVLAACTYPTSCEHKNATVTVTATCTQPGVKRTECPDCGNVTEEPVEALGHDFVVQLVNPTCTAPGSRKSTCSRCEESVTDTLPATGHSYKTESETPATCTVDGKKVSVCEACGDRKEETLQAPGHSYKIQNVAATCTAGGYTLSTCSACGDTVRKDTDPALGHQFEMGETVLPTCTEQGFTWYECARCTAKEQRYPQAALGHGTPVALERIEPTCTEEGGKDGMECPRCHELLVPYTPIPALGHDFGEGGDALACKREDCGTLIGDEEALKLRFKDATVYTPTVASEIPAVISDECAVLDLTAFTGPAQPITVSVRDLRVIGDPGKEYEGLSFNIDTSLEICFIELRGVSIKILDGSPFLRSATGNVVFLCSSGMGNKFVGTKDRAIELPNATLNIVGGANFSIVVDASVVDPDEENYHHEVHPAISVKGIVLYPYQGAEFSIRGGNGANGTDGKSYQSGKYATQAAINNTANQGGHGTYGVNGSDAIQAEQVTLYMAGKLSVSGGNGGNGGNGGRGEDSDLPRNGGSDESDGTAGSGGAGGAGGNGGSAICCSGLIVVYVNSGSAIELRGGNGGNGGDGGNGGCPYDGNWRDDAGDGGYGGQGGDAGFCIELTANATPSILNRDITLHGGSGGDGGDGGNGGNGVKSVLTDDSFNGGGGKGGRGGDAYLTKNCSTYNSATCELGEFGAGGTGGAKGTGGKDDKDSGKGIDGEDGTASGSLEENK